MNRHPRRQLPVGILFFAGTAVLLLTWIGVELTRDRSPVEPVQISDPATDRVVDGSGSELPSTRALFGRIGVVMVLTAAGGTLLWVTYKRD